tara:strand:- start:41 stop:598 length:558 start_codon:yes stop_codon:yes gene_type:complete
MGTIKATNIEPIADNGTVTLGSSGDTFSLGSGVLQSNLNYPAFDVFLSADQTGLTDQAYNLVKFDSEKFDTDSAFDTTDGQNRFTVPSGKAGKYVIYGGIDANPNADNQTEEAIIAVYKNGSIFRLSRFKSNNTYGARYAPIVITTTMALSVSDYVQLYFYGYDTNSAHKLMNTNTFFGGYRIGS